MAVSPSAPERTALRDGELLYWPALLDPALFDTLHAGIAWERHVVRIFGRSIPAPRLSAWYGEPGASYAYSGQRYEPKPWTPELARIRTEIEAATGAQFDSVLANLYRDGQDSMGWHSDAEAELGRDPVIASASFGAARRFVLKHRSTGERHELLLAPGSLLVMRGALQHHWKHALPRTRAAVGPRINLTFRRVQIQELG